MSYNGIIYSKIFYELLIFSSVYVVAGLLWIIVNRKKSK